MKEMIRSFNELTAEQQSLGGGKGGTLAKLRQAGYPVPDGFVIMPAAFAGDKLRPEAWVQVQARLARMRKGDSETAFAVRSSALSEDSAQASFAGEFETVLDVHTDEMIREAIRTVRQSRHSERVRVYSEAKGIDAAHEIAVVVQQLVRADISGVLFTADPVSGSRAQMTGNYVYGLGDELVSGEVKPYTFTLERPKGQYDGSTELKRFARKLYKLGSRLEKDLDCPQDIEWCIAEGKLYLLQSRPITTLIGYDPTTGEWNDSLVGNCLWASHMIGEIFPKPVTQSSWSLLGGNFQTWKLSGFYMFGTIGGRPYMNVSLLYSVMMKIYRNHERVMKDVEEMFGRLPEGMEIPVIPFTFKEYLTKVLPIEIKFELDKEKTRKKTPELLTAAPEWCRRQHVQIQQAQDKAELLALWRKDVEPFFSQIYQAQRVSNEDYLGPLRVLRRQLTEMVGEMDTNVLVSTVGGTSDHLASLGPVVDLAKVARGEMSREEYVERHGHRGPYEDYLPIPRPREDPNWLDRQLAEFEKAPVDVDALLARRKAEFDAAWQRFQERYPKKVKKTKRTIDKANAAGIRREAIRTELTRTIAVIRAFYLRAGELTGLGDDVFFLANQELVDVLSGDDTATAYLAARRKTHEKYSALPPYPAIIRGRFDPFQWAADPNRRSDVFDSHAPIPVSDSDTITGYGGSAGRVEGTVRCIDSPEEGSQLQSGEILVARTTNVGWTPLFPRAAAVITDVGTPLSHAAIVARELGIPAVVGCIDATMRLRTGDRVLVDGGRGVVEILDAV